MAQTMDKRANTADECMALNIHILGFVEGEGTKGVC